MKGQSIVHVSPHDFAILSICAIRYCHGRQTYMPSLVQGIVRGYLRELSDKDLAVMINDCGYQEEFNLYGSETIDKPGWLKWKEDLLKERERRNEQTGS